MNRRGFGILEALIAFGLVSIIGLAITFTLLNFMKQNKGLQQKLESIELEQNIVRLLSDVTSCDCIFKGYPFSGENISDGIKNGCAGNLIKPNSLISPTGAGLKVKSIKLQDLNESEKTADLLIDFNEESVVGVLKPIRIRSLKFQVSGGNIDRCFGSLGKKELCLNFGWTWENNKCTFQTAQDTCGTLGGSWNGSSCSLPGSSTVAAVPPPSTNLDCGSTPNGGYYTRHGVWCRPVSYPDNCNPLMIPFSYPSAESDNLDCQTGSYLCDDTMVTQQCVAGVLINPSVQHLAYYSRSDDSGDHNGSWFPAMKK